MFALTALTAVTGLALLESGCGGAPPPAAAAGVTVEPRWQDAFETTPELLVVFRPAALRQDKVYGPLLRRVLDAARERSRVVAATRILDVVQDADEVVVGMRPGASGTDGPGEVVVVVRGVPASADPLRVVDSDGHALWSPGPPGAVRELVRERDEQGHPLDASLFEMEGRVWLIATGDARARCREVFAHPLGRPELKVDPDALATARIDGASLVQRVRALQPLGGLAAIGRKLQSVTAVLPPGRDGNIQLVLGYAEEDAAAFSEVTARQTVEAIGRKKPERLAWLASAKVDRPDKRVLLTFPLPPQLIDSLLHAGSAPIDLEPGPSGPGQQ
jgi:hypothetical protein